MTLRVLSTSWRENSASRASKREEMEQQLPRSRLGAGELRLGSPRASKTRDVLGFAPKFIYPGCPKEPLDRSPREENGEGEIVDCNKTTDGIFLAPVLGGSAALGASPRLQGEPPRSWVCLGTGSSRSPAQRLQQQRKVAESVWASTSGSGGRAEPPEPADTAAQRLRWQELGASGVLADFSRFCSLSSQAGAGTAHRVPPPSSGQFASGKRSAGKS